jgi:hypothetical protein
MVRTCRMCVYYKPLLFPVQGVYRDGYCVKHKRYTNSTDRAAEDCKFFILLGLSERDESYERKR